MKDWTNESFANYVEELDNIAYNAGLSISGDSPSTLSITPIPGVFEIEPNITIKVELDSDGESNLYYFMPVVSLPTLDSTVLDYADSIHYHLNKYAEKIGPFCKELIGRPYSVDLYSYDDDDDYSQFEY